MNKNKHILIITGPIGAGKSTVAHQLAKDLGDSTVIDIEHVNYMLSQELHGSSNGSIEPKWLNFDNWEQSGEAVGVLAKHFDSKDYIVIIHGHINELLLKGIDKHVTITHRILLLPSLESATKRDRQRSSTIGDKAVRQHYKFFEEPLFDTFFKIDSSKQAIKETKDKIKDLLKNQ